MKFQRNKNKFNFIPTAALLELIKFKDKNT